MNAKQAKRLRRHTQKAIDSSLGVVRSSVDSDSHIRKRSYDRLLVPSKHFSATVTNAGPDSLGIGGAGTTTVHKDHAIHVRLTVGSPRQVYREVKKRVQSNRGKERRRVLSSVQLRLQEAHGAVEHTGAESVQRVNRNVPVL